MQHIQATQYMLSVHHGEQNAVPHDTPIEQVFADVDAFNQDLAVKGQLVFAGGLQPASTATVVDATGAKKAMHHGPYLPGPEYLGGYWVIRAQDFAEALEVAERASAACRQVIEVRPFEDDEQ